MGKTFFDQYSILHLATGIIAYFWGITFKTWFTIHALFELIENTDQGVYFIDNYITFWPGGKKYPDSVLNMVSDQLFAIIGWLLAYYLDKQQLHSKY